MLSSSVDQLKAALPSSGSLGALKDSPQVQQLRSLMQQVDSLKAERETIENELKNAQCDMSKQLYIHYYLQPMLVGYWLDAIRVP